MLFDAGGDGSEVLELVEEALDQGAVATKLCLDSLPAPTADDFRQGGASR
jgi:hypothetical protein